MNSKAVFSLKAMATFFMATAIQGTSAQSTSALGSSQDADRLIQDFCVDCHNYEDYSGGLAFDLMDINHVTNDPAVWEEAINKLRGRLMPPA